MIEVRKEKYILNKTAKNEKNY